MVHDKQRYSTESVNYINKITEKNRYKYDVALNLCRLNRVRGELINVDYINGIIYGTRGYEIGNKDHRKYDIVSIYGFTYYKHRFIYEYCFGEIPKDKEIDHCDRDTKNNSIFNLKLVSRSENRKNRVFKQFKK